MVGYSEDHNDVLRHFMRTHCLSDAQYMLMDMSKYSRVGKITKAINALGENVTYVKEYEVI